MNNSCRYFQFNPKKPIGAYLGMKEGLEGGEVF